MLNGENISAIDPLLLRQKVAMVLQKPFMFEGTLLENLQRAKLLKRDLARKCWQNRERPHSEIFWLNLKETRKHHHE